MHNGPHSSRLPGIPDEADLLAWVEGESLSAEAKASVVSAMQSDPVLARQLERMRGDRLALQSLGEERAPGGLIEAVESALQPVLERELLLGLKDGEPAESRPVVSMVRPEKRGIFQTFLADKAGRRMAMAASLLVLIGGATWWATVTLSGGTQPNASKFGSIAMADPAAKKNELAKAPDKPAADTLATDTKVDEGMKIAAAPQAKDMDAARSLVETGSSGAAALTAPETPMTLAAAEVVGPVKNAIDPTFAAELARERKLVIRVVSSEAGVSPRRVCDRIKKECNSAAWKLAAQVPSELTLALDAKPFDKSPSPIMIEPEAPAFAGTDAAEPLVGPPAPRTIPVIEESEPQPVYVVQARLDATTLSQLKTSLEKSGRTDEVVFEERYEALPLASGGVLTPQAVLWWGNSPAGWTNWGEVPVVIEPR